MDWPQDWFKAMGDTYIMMYQSTKQIWYKKHAEECYLKAYYWSLLDEDSTEEIDWNIAA